MFNLFLFAFPTDSNVEIFWTRQQLFYETFVAPQSFLGTLILLGIGAAFTEARLEHRFFADEWQPAKEKVKKKARLLERGAGTLRSMIFLQGNCTKSRMIIRELKVVTVYG